MCMRVSMNLWKSHNHSSMALCVLCGLTITQYHSQLVFGVFVNNLHLSHCFDASARHNEVILCSDPSENT
jgi:hypothetical protein